MTALANSAQKIGDIVKLIQTIAGQTNLLALNATIEAARAGECGPRFRRGRVGGQIARRADRKATEAIVGQILAVQGSTTSAVESIRRITQRMQEIQHHTSAVAASIEQQSAATSNISQNVATAAQASQTVATVLERRCRRRHADARVGANRARHIAVGGRRRRRIAPAGRAIPRRRRGLIRVDSAAPSGTTRPNSTPLPSAACAAARRAIGTRNGEQDT